MNIVEILANSGNYGGKRDTNVIKYIVIHYTGNDGDTAKSNGNFFKNNVVKASANYFVDDTTIVRSVPDNYIPWSVGGSRLSDYLKTGGATMYGIITNTNSLNVELCDTVKNSKYDFTEATLKNAVELVKSLMKKYNIDINHIYRHFDVTGKTCPEPMVSDKVLWTNFKKRLEEEAMTEAEKKEFNELKNTVNSLTTTINNNINSLKDSVNFLTTSLNNVGSRVSKLENKMIYNYIDSNMPSWARPTIQKLVNSGKLQGTETGLNLDDEMLRMLVILDRQGVFG